MCIQTPQRGRHTRQMHSSSNECSDDSSTPESEPDLPNARSKSVHKRVDPTPGDTARKTSEVCMRVDPTTGDASQGNAPCPADTHTRGAPRAGHTKHVSLSSLLFEQCHGSTQGPHPSTGVNNKGVYQSRSTTARGWYTLLYKPPAYCGRRMAPMPLSMVRGLYNIIASRYYRFAYSVPQWLTPACDILSWMHAGSSSGMPGCRRYKTWLVTHAKIEVQSS